MPCLMCNSRCIVYEWLLQPRIVIGHPLIVRALGKTVLLQSRPEVTHGGRRLVEVVAVEVVVMVVDVTAEVEQVLPSDIR